MKNIYNFYFAYILVLMHITAFAQSTEAPIIKNLGELDNLSKGIHHYWLQAGSNTFGNPMLIPVIVFKGNEEGSTLGLTAAIHGNELNGIDIIHKLKAQLDIDKLKGNIIAIPGLNVVSIELNERRFEDHEDLNRGFPGKENGNRSQQYVYQIAKNIIPYFDIHIDMHTASFGRVNTMYARADLANDTLNILAALQKPDIILSSKGLPSVGNTSASARTLRAEATLLGIPSLTVEYGNPQVYQSDMITRGLKGVFNTLAWLNMYSGLEPDQNHNAYMCKKSYWIYMDEGGFLELTVGLNQALKKGEKIAVVRNAFGEMTKEYFAPEEGIVIGMSTNPVNKSGGRIIHLGIPMEEE